MLKYNNGLTRFRTDADVLPGVERVSIMKPDVNILNSNYVELKKLPEADSVRPRSVKLRAFAILLG